MTSDSIDMDKEMKIGRFLGGIGVLLWHPVKEKYLLLRRSAEKDFAAGAWECVTGRVDQGEGFEDAARREVREELGVEVQLLFMIGTTHFYRGQELPENELIGLVYCGTIKDSKEIDLSEEHSDYRWLSSEESHALLSTNHASERWLLGVVDRAEATRKLLPDGLLELHHQYGFELDT